MLYIFTDLRLADILAWTLHLYKNGVSVPQVLRLQNSVNLVERPALRCLPGVFYARTVISRTQIAFRFSPPSVQ